MKKTTANCIFFFLSISILHAQTEEATTKSGKKVILNADGTWKYKEDKKQTTTAVGDCTSYIETTEDKMTGKQITAAKKTIIVSNDGGKKGFGILLMNSSSGSSIIMSIQVVGAGHCIEEGSKINILFRDGSRLELSSDGKFNCDGNATVYFGGIFGKRKQLEELKTKKIESMRIWTSDSFVERDFTTENSEDVFHILNCLSKE